MIVGMPGPAELMIVLALTGGFGLPLGIPPETEQPAVMLQVAPDECLYFTTWAGMAKPDPESGNEVEKLLAEPEIRYLISEGERRVVDALKKAADEEGPPEAAVAVQEGSKLLKTLITRPASVFVSRAEITPDGLDIDAGAIVAVADDAEKVVASLEKVQQTFLEEPPRAVEIAGIACQRIEFGQPVPPITWGMKGGLLMIGVGEGAIEGITARAATAPPMWLNDVSKKLPVKRRATITYVNAKALVDQFTPLGGYQAKSIVAALGLDNVESLVAVTGLDETGFVSRSLVSFSGQPKGLFQVVADKPLTPDDLAPIPADATLALAARLNADKLFEVFLESIEKIEPRARAEVTEGLNEMNRELGIDVRGDVLKSLGDVWCAYGSPVDGGLVLTGLTATVTVRDHKKLAAAHEKLIAFARAAMRGPDDGRRRRRRPQLKQVKFAGHDVYYLANIERDFPFAPAWCLTEKEFVVALFPQNVKAYLARSDDRKSLAARPEVASLFHHGSGPAMLFYQDTPELLKLAYPLVQMFAQMGTSQLQREGIDIDVSLLPSVKSILPHLRPGVTAVRRTDEGIELSSRQSLPGGSIAASAPVMAGMLIPTAISERKSARRARSMGHLKQLALAMHTHHEDMGKFPAAYIPDKDGKPLLSWRVRILPYLGRADLYDLFRLSEPWDSEHNKKLISRMPDLLKSPGGKTPPGTTRYLTVRGEDTIFPGKEETRMAHIRDGTSNTIMLVEAAEDAAVVWTKPDDLEYDAKNPLRGLVGSHGDGFLAAFADGSVRWISSRIDAQTLKRLMTKSDGEPIDHDRLHR